MVKILKGNTNLLFENLFEKKVLVLGSGPSAREIDWKSANWDVLVTTSFFYLNPEIISQNPIHITLSDIVDLEDKRLVTFLDQNKKCTIGFEPKNSTFYVSKKYKEFTRKFSDRIISYFVPGGKEGVASRTCWLVSQFNPSTILMCGIDGISKDVKKDPPNYFRGHIGTMDNYSYERYKKDYASFSKHFLDYAKKNQIEVVNLGKGKNYNMLTF